MALNQVSVVAAWVLRVILDGFQARTRAFSDWDPAIYQKQMSFGIDPENVGMIGCIFAENGPLEGGIDLSFNGSGWGAKGDFRWILGPNPCIFGGGPPPFSERKCPEEKAQKVWEWSDLYSPRMGP